MFESMLVIAVYLMAIFVPVLIPGSVHAVHFFRDWRPAPQPVRPVLPARLPRRVPFRRVAPAMG
ncbi:hypothetical protein AWC11_10120 [Mycobacterium interjectum]|nr:hypothetical protein AWC11_10120 [Mycobacterium interjectum]